MKPFIISVVTLFMITMDVASDPSPVSFEFSKTVAIYHLTKDGGIIYTRPSEYNEQQGFIRLYEAMDQYLVELNNPSGSPFLHPEEQPVVGEFLLVNGTATKKYFLKEGWLGDGEQWVPMSQDDYARLTDMLAQRKNLAGSNTTAEGLEEFTARIHEAAQENEILEFGKKFERDDDQKVEVSSPETDEQESSSARNTSDTEEIIQDRGYVQSESVDSTETSPERIAKPLPVSNDKEILDKVEPNDNSQDQDESMQTNGSDYNWKGAVVLIILIAGCFLYFRRKR